MSDFSKEPKKLITLSIPVFNEEENIEWLLARLREVAHSVPTYDFEFLFTDNASEDDTYALLAKEAEHDMRVRVVRFSRNFGYQRSILTNYLLARGAAAVQVDADLQDPPEMISDFILLWEQGYKVVYGVRRKRQENPVLEAARKLYYRLVSSISDVRLPTDAGDFRLVDRTVIDHLATIRDRNPYIRGIIASFGYKQIGVEYERSPRVAGVTKFNFFKLLRLGIDGIVSQSTAPLQYMTMFGFVLWGLCCLATLGYFINWIATRGAVVPGFTTLALLQLFTMGINAAFLGIVGEYVARVSENVRGHPFTIIDRTIEHGTEHVRELVFETKGE